MQRIRQFYRRFQPLYAPIVNAIKLRYWNFLRGRKGHRETLARLAQARANGQPIKVVIGSRDTRFSEWIPTDIQWLNATKASDWAKYFELGSIHRILAEHVIEHLTEAEFRQFLRVVRPFLTDDANLRFAVPDGYHPNPDYIEFVRPGGSGLGAQDHKMLYNHENLSQIIRDEGYECRLIEWYDRQGEFHAVEYDTTDGYVIRTHDKRTWDYETELDYTSLILDCRDTL